jgi:hypothetical protein
LATDFNGQWPVSRFASHSKGNLVSSESAVLLGFDRLVIGVENIPTGLYNGKTAGDQNELLKSFLKIGGLGGFNERTEI